MIIAGKYSFNSGQESIMLKYPDLLKEIELIIENFDAEQCKMDNDLYNATELNRKLKYAFNTSGWEKRIEYCNYSPQHYTKDYKKKPNANITKTFREINLVKEKLGINIEFGRSFYVVHNISAQMTIFKNLGVIDIGVEIVPVKQLTGHIEKTEELLCFEQYVWDLSIRGVSNIDIPIVIIGVDV